MTRFSKTILLLGTAILALNACSTKGPGEIGSKDDIVVKNNGLPQAQQQAAVKAEGEDFSSTVEQAEAIPTPEVAAGEPLPDTSPAMETAVAQHEAAKAPIPSDAASPADKSSAPVSEPRPLDNVAPTTPVNESVTPPPANAPVTATSPSVPTPTVSAAAPVYPAPTPAPVTTPAPATAPAPSAAYPLDPNAPYSPKAVAAANAAAGVATPVVPAAPTTTTTTTPAAVTAGGINFADPAVIRSAQAALKQKGLYKGAESGIVDTEFLNALTIYQAGNQLPVGGINEPTLRYLGVIE